MQKMRGIKSVVISSNLLDHFGVMKICSRERTAVETHSNYDQERDIGLPCRDE